MTWEARHFGVTLRLSTRITAYARPLSFVDEQIDGPFKRMRHLHRFKPVPGGTLMTDDFDYAVPLGCLGIIVDRLVLERYLRRLLRLRNSYIKQAAEAAPDFRSAE